MIHFKTKSVLVTAGVDIMNQVVVTTEDGRTIGFPLEFFRAIFEPEDEDAAVWIKAIEKRFAPPGFEYEAEMVPGEDGRMRLKARGK